MDNNTARTIGTQNNDAKHPNIAWRGTDLTGKYFDSVGGLVGVNDDSGMKTGINNGDKIAHKKGDKIKTVKYWGNKTSISSIDE